MQDTRQFALDDEFLEDIKAEIIQAKKLAVDEDDTVLVWTGGSPTPGTLVETRALVGERGAYRFARGLPSISVPATVEAIMAARIDRLPPKDKHLLQLASVIGKDVPCTLLQAFTDLPEEALRRGLMRLQGAEFLYEASLFPELEYTFKHALLHEVAYKSLLAQHRRVYHGVVGRHLETLDAGRTDEVLELLAHHFGRSTEAVHLTAAVQLLEAIGARNEVAKALVAQAHLCRATGDLTGARRRLERALVLFETLGTLDEPRRVQALLATLEDERYV